MLFCILNVFSPGELLVKVSPNIFIVLLNLISLLHSLMFDFTIFLLFENIMYFVISGEKENQEVFLNPLRLFVHGCILSFCNCRLLK